MRRLGRYEQAIASIDQALGVDSSDHKIWYNRGEALANLGRYQEALV